jgi:hypothetical protein
MARLVQETTSCIVSWGQLSHESTVFRDWTRTDSCISKHACGRYRSELLLIAPSFTLLQSSSSSYLETFLHTSLLTLSEDMEDFNIPSAERVALLKRLEEAMGDVPPYFWAACQICDLKALENLVEVARINPAVARIVAGCTVKMILHCK